MCLIFSEMFIEDSLNPIRRVILSVVLTQATNRTNVMIVEESAIAM